MNLAKGQALKIFLTSAMILILVITAIHLYNRRIIKQNHLALSSNIAIEISNSLEQSLLEKINLVKTISIAPVIIENLVKSNNKLAKLTAQTRKNEIDSKNSKWKSISNKNDKFILQYTQNEISQYLIDQQNNLPGEYGEIFITNKYGALLASTTKLTTYAHNHKYWWEGAYNDGKGAIYLDDRGYDESVGGYVLGIVIPIKQNNEIVGILKANLNILGSISHLLDHIKRTNYEKLSLIRRDGLIVYTKDLEPLSQSIAPQILAKLEAKENSFILKNRELEGVYALAEIPLTSNKQGVKFGGPSHSTGHNKSNLNESWYIVDYHPISSIIKPANDFLKILFIMSIFTSLALAITSMFIGRQLAKPILELISDTKHIAQGDYESKISIKRVDEIGQLAKSFVAMKLKLKSTTTTIDKLNKEKMNKEKSEKEVLTAAKKWQLTFDASNDIIWVLDEEHKIFQSNLAASKAFNLTPEQMTGMHCYSIVHDCQEPIAGCPFERARTSFKRESMELHIGEEWYEVTVDPILDDMNIYKGAIHFIRKITDRVKNKQEIESQKQKLEKSLEKSERNRIANLIILKDLSKSTKDLKSEINERKQAETQLKIRMKELEIFNNATVDRELKINAHREEINSLLEKLGEKPKYKIMR